jgi:hypothetical protein
LGRGSFLLEGSLQGFASVPDVLPEKLASYLHPALSAQFQDAGSSSAAGDSGVVDPVDDRATSHNFVPGRLCGELAAQEIDVWSPLFVMPSSGW